MVGDERAPVRVEGHGEMIPYRPRIVCSETAPAPVAAPQNLELPELVRFEVDLLVGDYELVPGTLGRSKTADALGKRRPLGAAVIEPGERELALAGFE